MPSLASFLQRAVALIFKFASLRFIGNISYSLYLFHIPVLLWIKEFNTSGTGQLILFFLVSIALAALIHVLIEHPFLSLVKREKNERQNPMNKTKLSKAIQVAFSTGQTYEQYFAMNTLMAKEGRTTGMQKPSYIEYTKLSAARMRRWNKVYKPTASFLDTIKTNAQPGEKWLIFSETWCEMLHIIYPLLPNGRLMQGLTCGLS